MHETTMQARHDEPVEPLDGQTIAKARRIVAQNSTDAVDCADLLDMLGLGGEPLCTECGEPMSRAADDGRILHGANGRCWKCHRLYLERKRQEAKAATADAKAAVAAARQLRPAPPPLCEDCYRHDAVEGSNRCSRCANRVTGAELRALVDRIKAATGMTVREIADRAGLNAHTLRQYTTPSSTDRRLGRDKYDRLAALAKEVGA